MEVSLGTTCHGQEIDVVNVDGKDDFEEECGKTEVEAEVAAVASQGLVSPPLMVSSDAVHIHLVTPLSSSNTGLSLFSQ
ncbi:hypothetical protein CHS0354_016253 [Potamilus streckersoni]|uniref:Uncharacterized protein n=1 Tax=Potamilus streckersoni TaxID=2493646 RepID=A0AAE0VKM0_9BIVA|nr:hypothetical protein CHS0354_016253 [Potamilus streckersoni]